MLLFEALCLLGSMSRGRSLQDQGRCKQGDTGQGQKKGALISVIGIRQGFLKRLYKGSNIGALITVLGGYVILYL